MKLTLSYQGPLPPRKRGISPVKAQLRRAFHPQIKAQIGGLVSARSAPHITSSIGGHDFVAPANARFRTAVELDVLLLAPRMKRSAGDTDNRLKTLIDGLTRPANTEQLQGFAAPVEGGPTYCLMDDDYVVQRIGLDSRGWYAPQTSASGDDALVVVTATIVLAEGADLSSPMANMFFLI